MALDPARTLWDNPFMSTIVFHIGHYDFTIPARYQAGHPLTEGEAQALNQLMTENIRNNVSGWVRKAARDHITITAEIHEALQTQIHAYALEYQFQPRNRRPTVSAVDAALDDLANTQAETEGNASGYAPDSPEVRLRYRQLLSDPKLKARAREIVQERSKIAAITLTEILGK
jgi:hypothetical protein